MKSFRLASKSAYRWHAVLMVILASGCSGTKFADRPLPAESKNAAMKSAPFADRVVFSSKQIPTLSETPSLGADFGPSWDPSEEVVAKALGQVPYFLNHLGKESLQYPSYADVYAKELQGLQQRMPTTVCQIVGVVYQGRRGLILNCFPINGSHLDSWHEYYVLTHDRGPRYWSVVYLLEEQKFMRFYIDLGF